MKPIGGYFELELSRGKELYPDYLKLNTGRNCLEYLLRAGKFKKIYLPRYSCKVLLEPLKKLNIAFGYYSIDKNLDPVIDQVPLKNEAFLYINYFGTKNSMVAHLQQNMNNLIVDNSQAFYSTTQSTIGTFYSARKFFGVPDGAYLATKLEFNEIVEPDNSSDRFRHLIRRIELDAEKGYPDFQKNNQRLSNQPILKMSKITRALLSQIDYDAVKAVREENFRFLHQHLSECNQLTIADSEINGPMAYPFYVDNGDIRKELIRQKIYVATYWPNVLESNPPDSSEYRLAKYLVPLPIDQRYSINDMKRVLNVLKIKLKTHFAKS